MGIRLRVRYGLQCVRVSMASMGTLAALILRSLSLLAHLRSRQIWEPNGISVPKPFLKPIILLGSSLFSARLHDDARSRQLIARSTPG